METGERQRVIRSTVAKAALVGLKLDIDDDGILHNVSGNIKDLNIPDCVVGMDSYALQWVVRNAEKGMVLRGFRGIEEDVVSYQFMRLIYTNYVTELYIESDAVMEMAATVHSYNSVTMHLCDFEMSNRNAVKLLSMILDTYSTYGIKMSEEDMLKLFEAFAKSKRRLYEFNRIGKHNMHRRLIAGKAKEIDIINVEWSKGKVQKLKDELVKSGFNRSSITVSEFYDTYRNLIYEERLINDYGLGMTLKNSYTDTQDMKDRVKEVTGSECVWLVDGMHDILMKWSEANMFLKIGSLHIRTMDMSESTKGLYKENDMDVYAGINRKEIFITLGHQWETYSNVMGPYTEVELGREFFSGLTVINEASYSDRTLVGTTVMEYGCLMEGEWLRRLMKSL